MKQMRNIFLVLVLFAAQLSVAQNQDLELARRYFDRTYYTEAIRLYEEAAKKDPTLEVVRNLADSYYFTNDYAHAWIWYATLIRRFGNQIDDDYYFRYVHTVKAVGKYEEAVTILRERYSEKQDSVSIRKLEDDVELLENITGIGNRFEIANLSVNTKNSEFGAMEFKGNLLYSGIRPSGKLYKWNDENYLDLLTVSLEKLQSGDSIATSFSDEINTQLHEGNAVFTRDGKTMYFTRNNSKNGKRVRNGDKVSHLQLFKADFADGKWGNILPLPFNGDDFSTEHPALSADEKTLYFASDMPGTIGSFDIFSVSITDGAFGSPQNLGAAVNTDKKEQFPFVARDGKLYFSSNGHFGYGALDVFVSDMKNGLYTAPLNVGMPVNSGYDDFAFNIDPESKTGYFASNRKEGKGGDDMYSLKETKPLIIESCKQSIAGTITDVDTGLPLNSALVILESSNAEIGRVVTSSDGAFSFSAACNRDYVVRSSKESYSSAKVSLSLKKERNKVNDASMALKSDVAAKKELEAATKKESETVASEKKKRIAKLLADEKDVVKDKDRLLIKTDPIYFDYDLWYIRKESKPILNRVIALMEKYPQMVVEIGSHTDVRGNNAYNLDLSSKRAASTREYFIEKGISDKRIFSRGYGETVNIIRCVPDQACNEEQHELNRRSEFVIKDL